MAAHSYLPNKEARWVDVNPRAYLETVSRGGVLSAGAALGDLKKRSPKNSLGSKGFIFTPCHQRLIASQQEAKTISNRPRQLSPMAVFR